MSSHLHFMQKPAVPEGAGSRLLGKEHEESEVLPHFQSPGVVVSP